MEGVRRLATLIDRSSPAPEVGQVVRVAPQREARPLDAMLVVVAKRFVFDPGEASVLKEGSDGSWGSAVLAVARK